MTTRTDKLASALRKLSMVRELNDAQLLSVLELASNTPIDEIAQKFDLVDFCHQGAWDQAALWIAKRSFPGWVLKLDVSLEDGKARAIYCSAHEPPFVVERNSGNVARAILEGALQARMVAIKVGIN